VARQVKPPLQKNTGKSAGFSLAKPVPGAPKLALP